MTGHLCQSDLCSVKAVSMSVDSDTPACTILHKIASLAYVILLFRCVLVLHWKPKHKQYYGEEINQCLQPAHH